MGQLDEKLFPYIDLATDYLVVVAVSIIAVFWVFDLAHKGIRRMKK